MKANELRLGNLVEDGYLEKVIMIDTNAIKLMIEDAKGHSYLPIPITEDWLFKFGFSKSVRPNCEDIYKDLTARMVLLFNEGNYAEMDLIQDDKRISFAHSHIKYVQKLKTFY